MEEAYPFADSPLVSVFPGRPIDGPPQESTLKRIADWVTACGYHEGCKNTDTSFPTRLLDLGGPGPDTIVKVAEPEKDAKGAYTALSYCWGASSNRFTTANSLLDATKNGIALASLPKTFRDAIALTRRLGVRYIWIDGLCICQDDAKDWERESARMAATYANAYLTISATGASGTSRGLFFDRPHKPYLRMALNPGGADILVFPLEKAKEVVRIRRVEMADEPLSERGWAFQERLLSRRILHFASDQVALECLEGMVFEDGLRIPKRYYHACPDKDRSKKASRRRNINWDELGKNSDAPLDRWNSLLEVYGKRKLRFAGDKLPALSGIAEVYSELMQDEYIAGVWRKNLIEGICWQSLRCTAVGEYRAPSWSWASVDGIAATGFTAGYKEIASVVDWHVEVDGDNPFGRIKDAWLRLNAALVPLAVSEKPSVTGRLCVKPRGSEREGYICGFDTIDRVYSVSAELVRDMDLYALVLAGCCGNGDVENPDEIERCMCLVVTPAGDSPRKSSTGAMKRVGWVHVRGQDFGAGQLDASTTITLV